MKGRSKIGNVLIIGGGNMGLAYAGALSACGVSVRSLTIVEINAKRRAALKRKLKARILDDLPQTLEHGTLLMLAVKPQDMKQVCEQLRTKLLADTVVISIMAGITISSLTKSLHAKKIVRCMPNLPAIIGRGITVACHPAALSAAERARVRCVLNSTGSVIEVADEKLLNHATAVSGSGPAYLFYFAEHLIRAAIELGFKPGQAAQLVAETIDGAAALWRTSGETPKVLREKVTSKKGTTHAAVTLFEKGGLGETLRKGVRGASKRAAELSRLAGK